MKRKLMLLALLFLAAIQTPGLPSPVSAWAMGFVLGILVAVLIDWFWKV